MILNAGCCVYSFILLWISLAGLDKTTPLGQYLAKESSLAYNLLITVIWCVQVFLQEWVKCTDADTQQWRFSRDWFLHGEALMSAYFLVTSAYACYEWSLNGIKLRLIVLEVVFNALFYLFLIGRNVRKYYQRKNYTPLGDVNVDTDGGIDSNGSATGV